MNNKCFFCEKIFNHCLFFFESVIKNIYIFIFARPLMQKINNAIFTLSLHGKGYKNCCDFKVTGEDKLFKLLRNLKPKLCIDIGANIGTYTEGLLRATDATIISFEPLPKAYEVLQKLEVKYPNRLKTINQAIGSKVETLEIFYDDEMSELASFSGKVNHVPFLASTNTNSLAVEVNTIDNFFNRSCISNEIDLIKIDTEGFEYEVLCGATNTIKNLKPKLIQIEFNWHQLYTGHSLYSFSALLVDYVPFQMLPYGKGLIKRDVNRPESNIYFYSNFLFVRNDLVEIYKL